MTRSAFIYCGTESASVLTGVLADDGTIRHIGSLSVAPESDALVSSAAGFSAKLSGAPRVEWVTAHPSGTWLYSFVSFWDKRPGILRTHAIADDGELTEVDGGEEEASCHLKMRGYQPCHAVWQGTLCACAHYLSGDIEVFDMSSGGSPRNAAFARLPGKRRQGKFEAPAFGEIAPHCHGLAACPGWLVCCDAGQACLVVYSLDQASGQLGQPQPCSLGESPVVGSAGQALVAASMGPRPRHVAFTAQHERLAVLCECTNVVTLHAFDIADGSVGPALHTCASFESMPRSVGCGIARSLASLLPTKVALLAALPFGLAAAAEVALHPPSGRLLVTTRGVPRGGSLRGLDPQSLASLQDIAAGDSPRSFTFDRAGSTLIACVKGGLETYRVAPDGEVSSRTVSGLPEGLHGLEVDCVECVERSA